MTVEFDILLYVRTTIANRFLEGLKYVPVAQLIPKGREFSIIDRDCDDHDPNDIIVKLSFKQKKENAFIGNKIKLQFMHSYDEDEQEEFNQFYKWAHEKPFGNKVTWYDLGSFLGTALNTGEFVIDYLVDQTEDEAKFKTLEVIALVERGVEHKDVNTNIMAEYLEVGSMQGDCESHWNSFVTNYTQIVKDARAGIHNAIESFNDPGVGVHIQQLIDSELVPNYLLIESGRFQGFIEKIVDHHFPAEDLHVLLFRTGEILNSNKELSNLINEKLKI